MSVVSTIFHERVRTVRFSLEKKELVYHVAYLVREVQSQRTRLLGSLDLLPRRSEGTSEDQQN